MRSDAASLNELGDDLLAEGRWHEAAQAYARATDADPQWSAAWFNLGLAHKRIGSWAESARANRRAVALDPADADAWWNLGIAATALGDWRGAREAWTACGIDMPAGDGPLQLDYGPVAVRIDSAGRGEVVWARRIDPARAVILNVPLPDSGFREGDIVLHDGAVNGRRMLNDREVPVFDVLVRLVPSPRQTFEAFVEAPTAGDIEQLSSAAESLDMRVEDWTRSVRPICRACSEGIPHEVHDAAAWRPARRIGISAAQPGRVKELLERWTASGKGRTVVQVRAG